MNNEKLKVTKTEKDLGVLIDDALSFKGEVRLFGDSFCRRM